MGNDTSFLDKQTRLKIQKAIQLGVDPQLATQRAIQYQRNLANQGSVLSGNLRSGNLFQGGNVVGDVANSLARPFVKTGQMVGGSAFEVARALASRLGDKQAYAIDPKTGQPKVQNPFLTNETLAQTNTNPLGVVGKQALQSAAVASYGIPLGGATKLAGLRVAPGALKGGALVGGLQAASEEGANLESVAKGALVGGALGKGFEVAGKVLGGSTKVGNKLGSKFESAGSNIRRNSSKIRLPSSVYGDSTERAVQKTLDDLGIKGTVAQKYAQLEPKMKELGKLIKTTLDKNPSMIDIDEVAGEFMSNLRQNIRSGTISSKSAQKEVAGYLQDLLKIRTTDGFSKGTELATLSDDVVGRKTSASLLNDLRMMVNRDYKSARAVLNRGGTLTDRQQVILAGKNAIDDVLGKKYPKIKKYIYQQSDLFKAEKPLGGARFNQPTQRFMGTSVPKFVTEGGTDMAGNALQKSGRFIRKTPNINISPYVPEVAARLGGAVAGQAPQQQANTLGAQQPTMPLPQTQLPQQQSIMDRLTPEFMIQMEMSPLSDEAKAIIRKAYAYKEAYAKDSGSLSATQQKELSDFDVSINQMGVASQLVEQSSNLMGPIRGRIGQNPYSTEAQIFDAQMRAISQQVGKAMEGGVLRKEDEEKYRRMLPTILDTPDVARGKIAGVMKMLQAQAQIKQQMYSTGGYPTYEEQY